MVKGEIMQLLIKKMLLRVIPVSVCAIMQISIVNAGPSYFDVYNLSTSPIVFHSSQQSDVEIAKNQAMVGQKGGDGSETSLNNLVQILVNGSTVCNVCYDVEAFGSRDYSDFTQYSDALVQHAPNDYNHFYVTYGNGCSATKVAPTGNFRCTLRWGWIGDQSSSGAGATIYVMDN